MSDSSTRRSARRHPSAGNLDSRPALVRDGETPAPLPPASFPHGTEGRTDAVQLGPDLDDETLQRQIASEEHFTVSAPSGTLGLVLESSDDHVPVVSGIRSDSVLFGEVRIGDRLLSVDGQDVSDLLTSEVSKLIASKRHQPIRRLVFLRPATATAATRPR